MQSKVTTSVVESDVYTYGFEGDILTVRNVIMQSWIVSFEDQPLQAVLEAPINPVGCYAVTDIDGQRHTVIGASEIRHAVLGPPVNPGVQPPAQTQPQPPLPSPSQPVTGPQSPWGNPNPPLSTSPSDSYPSTDLPTKTS